MLVASRAADLVDPAGHDQRIVVMSPMPGTAGSRVLVGCCHRPGFPMDTGFPSPPSPVMAGHRLFGQVFRATGIVRKLSNSFT